MKYLFFILISSALLLGCDRPNALDKALVELSTHHQLAGSPIATREVDKINGPMAQLGKQLFFSKSLSGDFDAACVSCHHPLLGGGDKLALPIGVEAADQNLIGPGRQAADGEIEIPRNSPTTFNTAFWRASMFWDGRVSRLSETSLTSPEAKQGAADPYAPNDLLAAQARFPVTSQDEMRGETFEHGRANQAVRLHLSARLNGDGAGAKELKTNPWPKRFAEVFDEQPITYEQIGTALAAYQRSQVFINNPWFTYLKGDRKAISENAKQGAKLFYKNLDNGGFNCVQCHRGDFFTDEQFHSLGVPQIGPGKNNGPNESDDFGRARETLDLADIYKFRTPSLLNVEVTGPYFHNGSAATLADAIRNHLQPQAYTAGYLEKEQWCNNPPFNSLDNCADHFPDTQANSAKALKNRYRQQDLPLSEQQLQQLVAFLQTLTDPCVTSAECLAPWLNPKDQDPMALKAEFKPPR